MNHSPRLLRDVHSLQLMFNRSSSLYFTFLNNECRHVQHTSLLQTNLNFSFFTGFQVTRESSASFLSGYGMLEWVIWLKSVWLHIWIQWQTKSLSRVSCRTLGLSQSWSEHCTGHPCFCWNTCVTWLKLETNPEDTRKNALVQTNNKLTRFTLVYLCVTWSKHHFTRYRKVNRILTAELGICNIV